jgi:hypothetical protein
VAWTPNILVYGGNALRASQTSMGASMVLCYVHHKPTYAICRWRYKQTLGDLKEAVAKELGVPPEHQLLFWHGSELTPALRASTLMQMSMNGAFGLRGYNTVSNSAPKRLPSVACSSAVDDNFS